MTALAGAGLLWATFLILRPILFGIVLNRFALATNTEVTARATSLHLDGEFFAEDLVIRPKGSACGYDDAIFKAQRLRARFTRSSLLIMRPKLVEISVRDFNFNALYDADADKWNLGAIRLSTPRRGGSRELPVISLKRGEIRLSRAAATDIETIARTPIDVKSGLIEGGADWYGFEIETAQKTAADRSSLKGWLRDGMATLKGGISTSEVAGIAKPLSIELMTVELCCDVGGNFEFKLQIEDLLNEQGSMRDMLADEGLLAEKSAAAALQRFFQRYRPAGRVDIRFQVAGHVGRLNESEFSGEVFCKDVAICDVRFPYPVEHITGPIELTTKGVVLKNLEGRHGEVGLCFSGHRDFGAEGEYLIDIRSDNMALDNDLYAALNDYQKKAWSKFAPRGAASIDYRVSRQSTKKSTLTVELRGASAAYTEFPYPLENLAGTLIFEKDTIAVSNLVSDCNDRKIVVNGVVTSTDTEHPAYDIKIKSSGIPLDATLDAALSEQQRRYYREVCLGGLTDANIEVFTPLEGPEGPTYRAEVSFKETSLKTDKLPIVINNVKGKAVFSPSSVEIEGLAGTYGEHNVTITGNIRLAQNNDEPVYKLCMQGKAAEVNGKVTELLGEKMRLLVGSLRPKGQINYQADFSNERAGESVEYAVTAQLLGNSMTFPQFPYPLKDVTGRLIISRDTIRLEDILGSTVCGVQVAGEEPEFRADGEILLNDGDFKSADMTVSATNVCLDNRLKNALPASAQGFYEGLSPKGFLDINLDNLSVYKVSASEKIIKFEGTALLKDTGFDVSPAITQVNAVLQCEGSWSSERGLVAANSSITAGTLRVNHKLLTNLEAVVDFDEDKDAWHTEKFIADFYGGAVTGKFELKKQPSECWKYNLQTGFESVDLAQFLADTDRERAAEDAYGSGTFYGVLNLASEFGGKKKQLGVCRLLVSDMKVGKLSPLAQVLNVLKLDEPGDFAFDQMVIDSYIKENKMTFRHLDLSGSSIAFVGTGSMDMEADELDLTLTARGKRLATSMPGLWQSLTDCMGMAVVRMEVTGTLNQPHVTTKTLPAIRDSLGILGTEPLSSKK